MNKLWGGRFEGELHPAFARFNASLPFDHELVGADLQASAAWARGLERAGVLTGAELGRIENALMTILDRLTTDGVELVGNEAEDVHAWVEGLLQAEVGDLARKLHTGRSRNDQVATDLRLWTRDAGGELIAHLMELVEALVAMADEHADVAFPGYTHLQRAQPVTVGHHLLAYTEMFGRDLERIGDALQRLDACPLGSGALAGTTFAVGREEIAEDLEFEGGPTPNSLDAVSDRDFVCELVFACAMIQVHLSRLAEDWIFFASHEAGFIRFGDAVSTGSSLMPQKKNPDAMELVRGKTGRVVGDLQALLVTLKGLPLAYDKDLQEDKEALFDAVHTTVDCLEVTAIAARSITVDRERCRAACETGFLNATDLADLMVGAGVAFRDAHERVGKAVSLAQERGVELHALPPELLTELFPELDANLAAELSVERTLGRRNILGGTGPDSVRAQIVVWKEILESWKE